MASFLGLCLDSLAQSLPFSNCLAPCAHAASYSAGGLCGTIADGPKCENAKLAAGYMRCF